MTPRPYVLSAVRGPEEPAGEVCRNTGMEDLASLTVTASRKPVCMSRFGKGPLGAYRDIHMPERLRKHHHSPGVVPETYCMDRG